MNSKIIKPNPSNPRVIKDDKFKKLVQSLKDFPEMATVRPVVIDETNTILGGNMRYKAMIAAGWEDIPVTQVKGWTEDQKREFIIKDNVSGGEWDWDLLANDYDLPTLEQWGVDLPKDLKQTEVEEDEAPEVSQEPPISQLGEVYQLGRHRLLCGDATKIEDFEKMMNGQKADMVLTDPPYNTGMTKKADSTWLSHMFNDSFTPEQFDQLITDSLANMLVYTKGSAVFYVCIDWRNVGYIKDHLEKLMPVKNVIVWDKVVHGLGSDYKFTYEMIVVGKKGEPKIENRIGTDYQDIWRVQRTMGRNEDHATVKPQELLKKPILHASKDDDIVLDPFGGSGSTLIVCEQTNRTCYMMELDPKYCDIIRKRYSKFIGKETEWQIQTPAL